MTVLCSSVVALTSRSKITFDVFRSDTAEIDDAGEAPNYLGTIDITFGAGADLTAGLEMPASVTDLTITGGNEVTFPNDVTVTSTFTFTGDADFQGAFTTADDLTVGNGETISVGNTLTFTQATPTVSVNSGGTLTTGSVVFDQDDPQITANGTASLGDVTGALATDVFTVISGTGVLSIDTFTLDLASLNDNGNSSGIENFDANIAGGGER